MSGPAPGAQAGRSRRGAADERRLRILVVTVAAGGVGGMQRHTHDLVRGLGVTGHDVEVICPVADGLDSDLYGARWTLLDARGRADRRWPGQVRTAFEEASRHQGFDVIHSESTSALPLMRVKGSIPVVPKYQGNYLGLARAHLKRALTRPRTARRELGGLAFVTRVHFGGGNAWAFRDCTSIVASRQQLRDTARSHFIRGPIYVVPNGVDVSVFTPGDKVALRRSLGLPVESLLLSASGRLNLEKGFDVGIEALSRLLPAHPMLRLVIVGGGEDRARLETHAERLGVRGAIEFAGVQPRERVAQFLAASDVFLFPTLRDEAGPLTLIEGMACGLPTVASRMGGVTEVLEAAGDPIGLLVQAGDVDGTVRAADRLLADPALRDALGGAARQRAVDTYSVERIVAQTVDVYRKAIRRAHTTLGST